MDWGMLFVFLGFALEAILTILLILLAAQPEEKYVFSKKRVKRDLDKIKAQIEKE